MYRNGRVTRHVVGLVLLDMVTQIFCKNERIIMRRVPSGIEKRWAPPSDIRRDAPWPARSI